MLNYRLCRLKIINFEFLILSSSSLKATIQNSTIKIQNSTIKKVGNAKAFPIFYAIVLTP